MRSPRILSTTKLPSPTRDFELRLHDIFITDPLALNTLLAQMPLFMWALRDGTWDLLAQLIDGAHKGGLITNEQYDAIRIAAMDARTPMVIPERVA